MLLDQGIVAVKGDRVEFQVERCPPFQAQLTDGVEPVAHQDGIAGGVNPAAIFRQERSLGDDVQAGEEGQSFVEYGAHDVAVACVAEELRGQERPDGAGGRDHRGAGESTAAEEPFQFGGGQPGEEEEQAAELDVDEAWRQVELTDVGHLGDDRTRLVGPFVVESPRQLGEALPHQDRGDGRRAERFAIPGQCAADVVDGEVLLP